MTLLADDVAPRSRFARVGLLAVVFVCAACGLVYELALVSLGSYLIGNTATQASIVLAVMVFAMGVGSLATKRLTRFAALAFALIEAALGIIGGLSVILLYLAFAFADVYTVAMVGLAFLIGYSINQGGTCAVAAAPHPAPRPAAARPAASGAAVARSR
mgnify:CR=1 FL=1